MQQVTRWLAVVVVVVAGISAGISVSRAETTKLELKRIESRSGNSAKDLSLQYVNSQHFFADLGDKKAFSNKSEEKNFKRVVRKEPEKYNAKRPFRCVAKLGGREYGFVLDAKSADSNQYDRLYFDRNHNGDLTDDEPLDAQPVKRLVGIAPSQFPRIDLTLDVDGVKCEYSFRIETYSHVSKDFSYLTASLTPAAYREGQITIGGKTRSVMLIDYNSDGRFDSQVKVDSNSSPDGQIRPEEGDVLIMDLGEKDRFAYSLIESKRSRYLSNLFAIDGRWYDVKVTPTGDTLTLTPSSSPLGKVTTPYDECNVVLYGKAGVVSFAVEKDRPAEVPIGEWRLLGYTIRVQGKKPDPSPPKTDSKTAEKPAGRPDDKSAADSPKQMSLLGALAKAFALGSNDTGSAFAVIRESSVSAVGAKGGPAFHVSKDTATALPFGPPYKAVVTPQYPRDKERLNLGLSLVGRSGEICNNMKVEGGRPARPELSIRTKSGEEVETGRFEYG